MNRFLPSLLFLFSFLCISSTAFSQWVRQYPMEKLENVLKMAIHDDGYGYAVGENDFILKLDQTTQLWDLLLTWDMNWDLKAVDYVSGTNGDVVAVGGQGLLLSTNGGMNWTEVAGAPASIVEIQITSATEVLVVAASGVFNWDNGTWTDLNLPISLNVKGAHILDSDHIYVYSQFVNPAIYATADGGDNWSMNTEIPSPDVVRFFNAQYGVATDGRKVYQSIDGGMTWPLISTNEIHNTALDLAFGENPNVIMAAANNGEPTISQDSGKTWTNFDMGTINAKNYSVVGLSDTEFWVGNDISSITQTIDGGTTWTETSGPERNVLYDTYFVNRNAGLSVGDDGTILRSFDGGTHWEELDFDPTRTCLSVYGLSENDVWLGVNKGIFHTTDMGDTWVEKLSLLGGSVNDILALSADRILATTNSGQLLRSIDSGNTWDTVYSAPSQLLSITRIDNQRLMATGYNGLIIKSMDQGNTWTIITPPEANLQYEQTHFIGDEGWMVSSSFKKVMWHSEDAGDTWSPIDLPIERFWEGLYFISPDTGVVVGRNNLEGRVYITYDGGQSWQGGHITSYPIYGVTGFPNPNGTAWIFGFGSDIEVLPNCNAFPMISDFMGELSPCQGDTVLYSINAQNAAQFFWIFPSLWLPIGDTNNDSVWVVAGPIGNNISVTASSPCGISETINQAVQSNPLPHFLEVSGEENPCEGSSVTYTASALSALQYTWSFPTDWTITTDPTLGSVTVDVGQLSGDISVQASNDCGVTGPAILPVNTKRLPIVSNVFGEAEPCQGSIVMYTADEAFTDEILWSFPADWNVDGSQNEATITFYVGATNGAITAIGQNECGMSAEATLDVNPKLTPEVSIIKNGNLLSLSQSGSTYQWYLNSEIIDGATGSEYTVTLSGVYHAVVVYANGCQFSTQPVAVFVTSILSADDILAVTTYPNPVNEKLYLLGIEGVFDYKIFDVSGNLALHHNSTEESIFVGTLTPGVYVIRLEQGEKTYQARFVIMR